MKKSLIILIVLISGYSYGQEIDKKVPEPKLATEPVNTPNNDKKPELKLVDPSTAKDERLKKVPLGKPELKLISK
nr:hypothetical protein [uncultured Fluviicola sp.]